MSRILYTKERWELVLDTNKKLMDQYLRNCKIEKKRPNTINEYFNDLRFFLCWNLLYNSNMSVLDFRKRHFDEYKYFALYERGNSNARVNRVLSAIRTMMSFAEDDDDEYEDYFRNPASKVKGLEKDPVKVIAFLSQEQIDLLRNYLQENKMFKHLFLLDILYDSGARINEIFQVNKNSTIEDGYIKVICKGGKPEYILLHDRARESLSMYLESLVPGSPFWPNKHGLPAAGTSTLRGWVGDMYLILKELDETTPYFTPHSFRHTMIENMCNGSHYMCEKIGRPYTLEEVQLLVHHASTDMTSKYRKPRGHEIVFDLFGIKIS